MNLVLNNVRKEYDGKVAVNNLSLEVPNGFIYGIIGPNGAGKTTTIRMVMNITAPDSGQVTFDGKPINDSFKDMVGYLPEERGLYKKTTVQEVLQYLGQLKGKSKADINAVMDKWLDRVQLLEYKDKKVESLSKGMQQKLQFVSTILHDPGIIILDEIFSGLDPLNIELIKDIILDLKKAGKTILFSTHVMEQAEKLCDYICMISKGNKVIDGKMSAVKAQFGKNSIHLEIDGDGSFIPSIQGIKAVADFNNYKELQLEPQADTNAILKEIVNKVTVLRFDIVEPSLYNIFIDMAKVDPSELEAKKGGSNG